MFRIVVTIPSSNYLVNHVVVRVVNAILVLSTIFLNAVTLITFWKSSQLRRKVCYFLIVVQSSVDLVLGALGGAFYTAYIANEITGTASCAFFIWMRNASFMIVFFSMANLSVMNIERYFGIVHPVIHNNSVTRQRLLICTFCVYSLCAIAYIMSFVFLQSVGVVCVVIIALFLATTVYCYIGIFVSVKFIPQRELIRRSRTARRQEQACPSRTGNDYF